MDRDSRRHGKQKAPGSIFGRFLVMFLPVGLLLTGVLTAYLRLDERNRRVGIEAEASYAVRRQAEILTRELRTAISDLMFLADATELCVSLVADTRLRRRMIEREFLSFATRKGCYDQVRLIDPGGAEMVRVNFHGGKPAVVPEEELQAKGGRYYMKAAGGLAKGDVYVSPFDLNVERGKIESPRKPVIRLATPVYEGNTKVGILVLNYLGGRLLAHLKEVTRGRLGKFLMVNEAGYFLAGLDPADEWGFMYPDGGRKVFGAVFPGAWKHISSTDAGILWHEEGFFFFDTVRPLPEGRAAGGPVWKILYHVSPEILQAQRRRPVRVVYWIFFPFLLLLAVGSLLWAYAGVLRLRAERTLQRSHQQLERCVLERTATLSEANTALERLNRTLKALTETNHALIRAETEEELLKEVCRIIVEVGGYRFAWVGFAEHGPGKRVRPAARWGHEDGYLDAVRITWGEDAYGRGPTGRAVKTGRPVIAGNLLTEPGYGPWREEAAKRGYASSIAVPLVGTGEVIGALNIYAGEPYAFTPEEVELLKDLAQDLSFGITSIRMREEREEAMRRIRKLSAFPEANPNPIIELDPDAEIVYANAAAGWLAQSFGEKRIEPILPPDLPEIVAECLKTGRGRQHVDVERDGRTLSWSFYPIKETGSVHCYGAEITELKELEEQLQQAQRMEAIGTLASGVAHDFNNLLTVIKGNIELALVDLKAGRNVEADLEQVKEAAARASELTRQLLLYSRRQRMDMAMVDLNEVVEGLVKMLRRLIGEDVEISMELAPEVWRIKADKGNIEQVIMNIAVNARDAMPEGGTLFIRTENVELDDEGARTHPRARPGRFVHLLIKDTGVGMDRETLKRIFEPFFTTKGEGKGTGLGMSVVYGIVDAHQGWITVHSEPGKGTAFDIYLPVAGTGEFAEEETTVREISDARGRGERILLVEDEEIVKVTTQKMLEYGGYRVTAVSDAGEALEAFRREENGFDLVFTDTVLPDKSGVELLEILRKEDPKVRVLLGSGYTGERVQRDVIEERRYPFVQKPYDMEDLLVTLKRILTEGEEGKENKHEQRH